MIGGCIWGWTGSEAIWNLPHEACFCFLAPVTPTLPFSLIPDSNQHGSPASVTKTSFTPTMKTIYMHIMKLCMLWRAHSSDRALTSTPGWRVILLWVLMIQWDYSITLAFVHVGAALGHNQRALSKPGIIKFFMWFHHLPHIYTDGIICQYLK